MKNYWGTTINNQEESGDNYRTNPIGGLTSRSKKIDNGYWCPVCFQSKGKYVWLEKTGASKCYVCGTRKIKMDQNDIKRIMSCR